MTLQILTANRLREGDVVYLTADDGWSTRFADAMTLADDDAADQLLKQAERDVAARLIVAPYLMKVAEDAGRLTPLSQREAIRARGPSVRPDLGKQAE